MTPFVFISNSDRKKMHFVNKEKVDFRLIIQKTDFFQFIASKNDKLIFERNFQS